MLAPILPRPTIPICIAIAPWMKLALQRAVNAKVYPSISMHCRRAFG